MIRAALAISALLGPIFPCAPRSKRPTTAHGFKDASRSRAVILGWWQEHPRANIGLRTGPPSDLLVVDVDPRNGGDATLDALTAEHGPLPHTARVVTGGGGQHLYFRLPSGTIRTGANVLGAGLDVKGDGGYVLAPGSVHPSGERYRWATGGLSDVAPCPPWIVAMVRQKEAPPPPPSSPRLPPSAQRDVYERARKYLDRMPPAISGSRGHDATIAAARVVAVGFALDAPASLDLLLEWNQRAQPPWRREDLERKIREALRTSTRAPGYLLAAAPRRVA